MNINIKLTLWQTVLSEPIEIKHFGDLQVLPSGETTPIITMNVEGEVLRGTVT